MSNLWLQVIVVALDEETEPISTLELYAPTIAQDTLTCANDS